MKYKYLKGSEKDFEGAPEWAMQVVECTFGDIGFVEFLDYMCKYKSKTSQLPMNISNPGLWEVVAERQPITEPSWDGVGLPPVGCECEMQDAVGEFIPVDIIANRDGFAFGWNYDRHAVYFSDKRCEFRPIRSEADKRRSAAIGAMEREWEGVTNVPAVEFELIYDLISAGKIPGVKLED